MGNFIDLTGQKFGMLTVLHRADIGGNEAMWCCLCDCGKYITTRGSSLRVAGQKSCGCIRTKQAGDAARITNTKHGGSPHRGSEKLYNIWQRMKARCYRPTSDNFRYYGGRGIKVCDEWRDDYAAFRTWALENGYAPDLSIDRIDVNGDYSPENCRWATQKQQMNNTRRTVYVEYNGERKTLREWEAISGIPASVIRQRIETYHYSPEEALTIPLHGKRKKN